MTLVQRWSDVYSDPSLDHLGSENRIPHEISEAHNISNDLQQMVVNSFLLAMPTSSNLMPARLVPQEV